MNLAFPSIDPRDTFYTNGLSQNGILHWYKKHLMDLSEKIGSLLANK